MDAPVITELPACLCPAWQENPYGLVSLWDIVIACSGEMYFWAGSAIESLKADCYLKAGLGAMPFPPAYFGPPDSQTTEKAIQFLDRIREECQRVGMNVSAETTEDIQRVLRNAAKAPSYEWLYGQLENLRVLIRKEMKTKVFLYITPEKMRFWPTLNRPHVFGECSGSA